MSIETFFHFGAEKSVEDSNYGMQKTQSLRVSKNPTRLSRLHQSSYAPTALQPVSDTEIQELLVTLSSEVYLLKSFEIATKTAMLASKLEPYSQEKEAQYWDVIFLKLVPYIIVTDDITFDDIDGFLNNVLNPEEKSRIMNFFGAFGPFGFDRKKIVLKAQKLTIITCLTFCFLTTSVMSAGELQQQEVLAEQNIVNARLDPTNVSQASLNQSSQNTPFIKPKETCTSFLSKWFSDCEYATPPKTRAEVLAEEAFKQCSNDLHSARLDLETVKMYVIPLIQVLVTGIMHTVNYNKMKTYSTKHHEMVINTKFGIGIFTSIMVNSLNAYFKSHNSNFFANLFIDGFTAFIETSMSKALIGNSPIEVQPTRSGTLVLRGIGLLLGLSGSLCEKSIAQFMASNTVGKVVMLGGMTAASNAAADQWSEFLIDNRKALVIGEIVGRAILLPYLVFEVFGMRLNYRNNQLLERRRMKIDIEYRSLFILMSLQLSKTKDRYGNNLINPTTLDRFLKILQKLRLNIELIGNEKELWTIKKNELKKLCFDKLIQKQIAKESDWEDCWLQFTDYLFAEEIYEEITDFLLPCLAQVQTKEEETLKECVYHIVEDTEYKTSTGRIINLDDFVELYRKRGRTPRENSELENMKSIIEKELKNNYNYFEHTITEGIWDSIVNYIENNKLS